MKSLEKKLLNAFRELPTSKRETLLAFAEFLLAQRTSGEASAIIEEPLPIERPGEESVIVAIKRLSASYPMLDKAKLLNDTSNLVTQHVMQGRSKIEVIDELEVVFRRHYDVYLNENS